MLQCTKHRDETLGHGGLWTFVDLKADPKMGDSCKMRVGGFLRGASGSVLI